MIERSAKAKHIRALRIAVCLLSILVVLIAGRIGEELLGIAVVSLEKAKLGSADLHFLAAFVFENYKLNQNHFLLSLAPLVVILTALPFLDRAIARWDVKFPYALTALWLVFMTYFSAFTYALLITFSHIGVAADYEATIVTYAAVIAGLVVIAVLIALYARGRA